MKKLALALFLLTAPAQAGTLTVTATGFTSLPAAVTNQYTTFSDADFASTLAWGKVAFNAYIQATYNPTNNPAFVPSNTQIWNAIVHNWTQVTLIGAVQQFGITPPVVPPPIVIGP